MTNKNIFQSISLAALFAVSLAAAPIQVGTRLSLVIDVSGSVSTSEYNLQMDGYGAAFRNATNQALIINGGGVAVNYVFFASTATTASVWTLLNDVTSINNFATLLEGLARPGSIGSNTDIDDGMLSSLASFADTTYTATRNVMDVSGDGTQNEAGDPRDVRDAAALQGIVINGLPIGGGGLDTYYANNIITAGGFVESAAGFADFTDAINRKLFRELGGDIPEPSTYALMATGLLGLAYFRRKK